MGLTLYWYDTGCFAIVVAAILASLWMLRKEGGESKERLLNKKSEYESLLSVRNGESGLAVAADQSGVGFVEATCLWRSAWRGVHPAGLLLFRLVAAAVMAGALLLDLRKYDASIFVYYTEWTFLLVIIYFLIGTFISAHGCWVYSRQKTRRDVEEGNRFLTTYRDEIVNIHTPLVTVGSNSGEKLEEKRAGTWGYCMQIIYQTCGGAVILTDVVFWCLLVPFMTSAHFNLNLLMGCMHTLNLLFLLIDTFLNSMPFPWFRMTYFILWSCAYVIFQWILHACGFSWWPYPFLELATPWAPLWYFCMALIHVPCYGIYWLIVKAKNMYFPKLFPHSYVRIY